MPLLLFLILNIIAAACKNSFLGYLWFFFVLASASVGGGRKQKFLKRTKCGLRKEKNVVVFGMARALEHMGRFIGPLPEFHRETYRLSEAIKIEIVRLHRKEFGTPYRISKHLKISKNSVIRWIDWYEEERNLKAKVNANGRPSLTTENEDFLLTCSGLHLNFYSWYRLGCFILHEYFLFCAAFWIEVRY